MPQRITGHTELIGLIATPIRHSKSPMMHNTAFEMLGLDYVYLAFEVESINLESAVNGLKAIGAKGLNVSMPHKTPIIKYLDEISPVAKMCGAVNTVLIEDGKLYGTITDGTGFMKSLEMQGIDVKNQKITVIGAGGAATAICMQAAADGVKEMSIFNRNDEFWEKGVINTEQINANTDCKASIYRLEDKDRLKKEIAESMLLVNATNVGMGAYQGQSVIPDESYLRKDLAVADVIYSPEKTRLLEIAESAGCYKWFNGIGMMLYQGAAAFKIWTGKDMPAEEVLKVL